MSKIIHSHSSNGLSLKINRRLQVSAIVLLVFLGSTVISLPTAQASTFRVMSLTRYDLLLNGPETKSAGTTTWGPVAVCGNLVLNVQSAVSGANWAGISPVTKLVGADLIFFAVSLCGRQVTICASKAYYDHKWAGMTITVKPLRAWCWEY